MKADNVTRMLGTLHFAISAVIRVRRFISNESSKDLVIKSHLKDSISDSTVSHYITAGALILILSVEANGRPTIQPPMSSSNIVKEVSNLCTNYAYTYCFGFSNSGTGYLFIWLLFLACCFQGNVMTFMTGKGHAVGK